MDGKLVPIFPKSTATEKYSSIGTVVFDILQSNGRAINAGIETFASWTCNAKIIKGVGLRRFEKNIGGGQYELQEATVTDMFTYKYDIKTVLSHSFNNDFNFNSLSFVPMLRQNYDLEEGSVTGVAPYFPPPWMVFNEIIRPFIHEDGFYFEKIYIGSSATSDLTVNSTTIEETVDYSPTSSRINDLKITYTIEETFD
jgi:hypothetical protein